MEDDDMASSASSSESSSPHQSFTPLHLKKRLPQEICLSELCPSMDLIALGLGTLATTTTPTNQHHHHHHVSSTIVIHRTISWEKIFSLSRSDLESIFSTESVPSVWKLDSYTAASETPNPFQDPTKDPTNETMNSLNDEKETQDSHRTLSTALTWSPDGRTIVLGLTQGGIVLYDLESSMMAHAGGMSPTPIQSIRIPLHKVSQVEIGAWMDHVVMGNASSDGNVKSSSSGSSATKLAGAPSPVVTRSMTAARRKRLMRMAGKTPEEEKTAGDNSTHTKTQDTLRTMEELGWKGASIVAMKWQRYNPPHQDWVITEEEEEEEIGWNIRSYYLDKAYHFLPPCAYNESHMACSSDLDENMPPVRGVSETVDHGADFDGTVNKHTPKSQTPLSVLCVATCANGVHFYLHGRYRILSLPCHLILSNEKTRISCSSDLINFVVASQGNPPLLSMYTIPLLGKRRRDLQRISSSFSSVMAHLSQIEAGMKEAAGSWSGSLRQLDMKFDQLTGLLLKYGVLSEADNQDEIEKANLVRKEILNYILGGHSNTTEISNAMDQFFTHPLMNDQLLQRLERTLEANLAGVESTIRKKIQAPVRALAYEVSEMHGFVKTMNPVLHDDLFDYDGCSNHYPVLMKSQVSMKLCEASKALLVSTELCVSHLIEIRFRLDNLMKWIRSTASQVKAKGTSSDSVQKKNARKRRVPNRILQKMVQMLSNDTKSENSINMDTTVKRGSTESVLGILFSDNFSKPKIHVPVGDDFVTKEFPSMYAGLHASCRIAVELFEEPRAAVATSAKKTSIEFEGHTKDYQSLVALHNRLGSDGECYEQTGSSFTPNVLKDRVSSPSFGCRRWTMVATSLMTLGMQMIQICAIPDSYSSTTNENELSHYLSTYISIPVSYIIVDVQFYGDDGSSNLTSDNDSFVKEGNQKIGLVLKSNSDSSDSKSEILLLDYDDLSYKLKPIFKDNEKICIKKFDSNEDVCATITWSDESAADVSAKWREIPETKSADVKMILCGSKGIGVTHGSRIMNVFDMEEDEESDEE